MKEVSENPLRLFTGIALPDAVRAFVARVARSLSGEIEGVRWVPDENLHVTLKFLGDCDPASVGDVLAAMEVARGHLPFHLDIGGMGAFPSQASARILWVGAVDPSGRAALLFADLEKALRRLGFARDKRPYRPHVTIGRARRSAIRLPEGIGDRFAEVLPLEVRGITLYRSRLSSSGATYEILGRVGTGDETGG
ncbi:MAG: RNA 2',3'-cyclic phosphodiesterase [Actinobacteria bacterium]|nr:RNA 2',3'-cyclic phosphodiesterase [Actinomycetota bacterium]MBU1942846.1 RNA 2',3'-cyclic phosphodiesterase [Actinomycetota bacterium]MBU2687578.1 RNA 2',3'-cyclic phosphodiesterase [Actinomycetota bacterium]